jgi:hypothetical protein
MADRLTKKWGVLFPREGEHSMFNAVAFPSGYVSDFARYEEVIGNQAPLPKGLVWAHRIDHCPSSPSPYRALDEAIECARSNELTSHMKRKIRNERKMAA